MRRRVLLVEDHPIALEGLRALIAREPDLEIVGEASSASDALHVLDRQTVDLMLVDVTIAGGDGIELTKSVRAMHPEVPVLVISAHDESVYAERAVRAGASGYVMKTEAPELFLVAIREALAGRLFLSPTMRQRLLGHYLAGDANPASASPVALLTDRELEVYGHFGRGLSTSQVAELMTVSPKTVETHRVNIKRKLSIENTNELVRRAALWVASTGT